MPCLKEVPQVALEVCDLIAPAEAPDVLAVLHPLECLYEHCVTSAQFDAVTEATRLVQEAAWFGLHPRDFTAVQQCILRTERPWDLSEDDRAAWCEKHEGGLL